jgi:DNA-binding IclR family transcriptional regulator
VRMGMLENGKIAYVEEKPDLMPGNSFHNRARLPVHRTALGDVLLAHARVESRGDGGGPRVGQAQRRYSPNSHGARNEHSLRVLEGASDTGPSRD